MCVVYVAGNMHAHMCSMCVACSVGSHRQGLWADATRAAMDRTYAFVLIHMLAVRQRRVSLECLWWVSGETQSSILHANAVSGCYIWRLLYSTSGMVQMWAGACVGAGSHWHSGHTGSKGFSAF